MREHGPATPVDADAEVLGPSNRTFGLFFGVVLLLVGVAPLRHGWPPRGWALVSSGCLVVAALAAPGLLAWPNRLWLWLGLLLHRIVNPVVMAVLFYGAVLPFGLALRVFGKGLAPRLRPDASASSYWIDRKGEAPSRMDQQF